MTMTADAAEIVRLAESLNERQCDALLSGWESVGVARTMKRKGLSSGYLGSDPRNVAIVETELGVAVANHLRARAASAMPTASGRPATPQSDASPAGAPVRSLRPIGTRRGGY